jgi:hypothetical protein
MTASCSLRRIPGNPSGSYPRRRSGGDPPRAVGTNGLLDQGTNRIPDPDRPRFRLLEEIDPEKHRNRHFRIAAEGGEGQVWFAAASTASLIGRGHEMAVARARLPQPHRSDPSPLSTWVASMSKTSTNRNEIARVARSIRRNLRMKTRSRHPSLRSRHSAPFTARASVSRRRGRILRRWGQAIPR